MKSGLYDVPGRLPYRSRRRYREPVGASYDVILEAIARIEIHRQRPPAAAAAGGLLAPALSLRKHESGNTAQRLEDAGAVQRIGGERWHLAKVQRVLELGHAGDERARQVLLVVLDHERHGAHIDVVFREIRVQILHALDVLGELARLAVGDEHDAVGAVEHELARRLVVHLAGDGVELEARRESRDGAQVERQKIEEQRSIRLRREGDHLPFAIPRHLLVNVMQVGRLPRPPRAVVDDLAGDLAGGVVDQ